MGQSSVSALPASQRRVARAAVAVGYCRRSTDKQEQSIPDQKLAIEMYAREHHLKVLTFYIDDAISGTSTVGRKAFQQLIEDATRPTCEFGLVLVYDVKRFGRVDNDEAGYYRHILKTHGVEVCYCSENFTGDRTDDLLRPVKQWQAREESKDLSKVTIRGLLSRVNSPRPGDTSGRPGGFWVGGVPPYGYDLRYENHAGEFLFYLRYLPDCSKQMFDEKWTLVRTLAKGESVKSSRKDRARLVPSDAKRVEAVQRIFQLFVEEGRGYKSIAQRISAEGAAPIRNPQWHSGYSGQWNATSIRSIVTNPAYAGDLVWNKRSDGRFHKIVKGVAVERREAKHVRLASNDEADWIVVRDAHEPLVSRRLWESARQILKKKPSSTLQRGVNPRTSEPAGEPPRQPGATWIGARAKFLLSGIMTCPRCGRRYEGRVNYGKRSEDERRERKRTFVYACGGHIRYGRRVCTLGAVPQAVLENAIIDSVLGFYARYMGADGKHQITEVLKTHGSHSQDQIKQRKKSLQALVKKADKTLRSLVDNITTINRDLVDARIIELRQEREQAEAELTAAEHMVLSANEIEAAIDETAMFVASLEQALRDGTAEERHTAMRRCAAKIVPHVDERHALIQLRTVPSHALSLVTNTIEDVAASWDARI